MAGHVAITFSGYATDPREIYDIPEIRAYWKEVDRSLPELPALLTVLPITGYNGSGQHVMPLGTVDAVIDRPEAGRYDVHVVDGPQLIADAVSRIRQAGRKYHLSDLEVSKVVEQFRRNARGE